MDLLRFVSIDGSISYLDSRAHFVLTADTATTTKIFVMGSDEAIVILVVPGDVDEVAQLIERSYEGARTFRIESAS